MVVPLMLAAATCSVPLDLPPPPRTRPAYALTIRVAPSLKQVQGTLNVVFAPEVATDRIVFRLWPNSPVQARAGAKLTIAGVRVNNRSRGATRPDPTTLVIAKAVAARERVTIAMRWTLGMPRVATERLATGRALRLSSFFPLLAWNGSGWETDPPAAYLETWTSPVADFDVRVTVPKGLRVFASGAPRKGGRWHATAVRDFALEAARFRVATAVAHVPNRVVVTAALAVPLLAPRAFLDRAMHSLTWLSQRYGPYPWTTFAVVVVADQVQPFGEEYPTIVFISAPSDFLIPHETAHQWFYSLVGNDQARDPWLDETLAQWASARYGGTLQQESEVAIPSPVANRLGEPMLFWSRFPFMPTTFAGLYEQGVKALHALGDDAVVDCALRRYVRTNAYTVSTPNRLLDALRVDFPNAERVLAGFGARF
jgi:hypothetical protein